MRLVSAYVLTFAALLALRGAAEANPTHDFVKTRIVALVDGQGQDWVSDIEDPVHRVVEMPLNYLGMVVRRYDIRKGPPPEGCLDEARAVLTWFDHVESCPEWLWPWLEKAAKRPGLRFVHLNGFGALTLDEKGQENPARLARWLGRFGLGYNDYFRAGPIGVETTFRDPALCAYEADPRFRSQHSGPWNLSKQNVPWVTTRTAGDPDHPRTPVITGPWGGIALVPWHLFPGSQYGDRRWYLDPFAFFAEALGLDGVPAPQPNVLNGRRMFFCHVDGDGFESLSTVRTGEYAGRIFLEEIIDKIPLPYTMSIIVASLTDDFAVEKPTGKMRTAIDMFRRHNVEPASHGVLHPFVWQKKLFPRDRPGARMNAFPALKNYEATPLNEVRESFRFIRERLIEDGHWCRVMLWTGDTAPDERTVREVALQGGWNLNGGTFRWDRAHDSVAYVSPWARMIGESVQVYAGAPNENEFPGFFRKIPTAFRHVDETIRRTGEGRILKPADVYLHFYSAERPARLAVAQQLIRKWGLEEPTAPVFASAYCAAVTAALTTARIEKTADGWSFTGFGRCRTIRIDGEPRDPDLARSTGILGYRRMHGSLYLHLSMPVARVVLAKAPPRRPHVLEANHELLDAKLDEKGIALLSEALCPRLIVFAGLPPDSDVTVTVDERTETRRTDTGGRVEVTFPNPGRNRVEVRVP